MPVEATYDPAAARRGADRLVKPVMVQIVDDGVELAKHLAPVDTGRLRDGIHAEVDSNGDVALVSDAPYSVEVEHGTRDMAAQPFAIPAMYAAIKRHTT